MPRPWLSPVSDAYVLLMVQSSTQGVLHTELYCMIVYCGIFEQTTLEHYQIYLQVMHCKYISGNCQLGYI